MVGSLSWLLVLLGSSAAAQEPDTGALRRALDDLRAGQPGEPAFDAAVERLPLLIESGWGWFVQGGAYLAGRHGRGECVPALLAALERENRGPPEGDLSAKGAILDALVLLEARVPAALLTERLEESSLPETYLLLLRDAEHGADGLLALFDAAPPERTARWAAASALVAARDPRVARRLLLGMEWELEVGVREPGSSRWLPFGGAGGGWSVAHELWPPRVSYELLLPGDGAPLLPIPYRRMEETRSGSLPHRVLARERAARRDRLLEELLGESEERGLLRRPEDQHLAWSSTEGAEAYRLALRARCLELRERLTRVASRLEGLGLLERSGEVATALVLRVRLHDLREEPKEPLPSPPELPGVLFEGPKTARPR